MSDAMGPTLPILSPRVLAWHSAFADAGREFGPLPLWFWNADLDEVELLRQLDLFENAGCAGAIVYARHGLRTAYLSSEWMSLVRVVAARARERGLQLWVADDENWPGGVGPDAGQGYYLKVERRSASAASSSGDCQRISTSEPASPDTGILAACAFVRPPEGTPLDAANVVDLAPGSPNELGRWSPPDGLPWEIVIFSACSYPHRDFLADGSGEDLLRSTHALYEAAMGDLLSAGITGFFSDELAPVSVWNVPDPTALPWTPALKTELSDPSLLHALLPLAVDIVGGWPARNRYWRMVADRYDRQFFQPIQAWIQDRGLAWAGHLLFEEPLLSQVIAQADSARVMQRFTMPVVDNLLLRKPGIEQNLAASGAQESGHPAAVESFGGAGWGLDLASRRNHVDVQAARGMDRLIPHGVFYSSAGKRKRESPPSEFLREPFSAVYPDFAQHVSRIGWAMSQGRPGASVALLYPLRSAWSAIVAPHSPLGLAVEEDLRMVAHLLEETNYEYAFLSEDSLAAAEISGARLRVGPFDFSILVLPSCPFISREAWERVMEFLDAGGQILALGMIPEGFEDGPDEALQEELLRLAAVEADTVRRSYLLRQRSAIGGQEVFTHTYKSAEGGRFSAFQAALSPDAEFARGEVRQILNACCPPDVDCRDLNILCRRRILGGLDLYWIVSIAEEPAEIRLGLRGHGSPEIWNTLSGAREPIWQHTWVGTDQTNVTLRLHPAEGVLVALPAEEWPHVESANFVVQSVAADDSTAFVRGYDDPIHAVKVVSAVTGQPHAVWREGHRAVRLETFSPPAIPSLNLDEGWHMQRLDANVLVLDEWRYRPDERGGGRILGWHKRSHPDWSVLPEREPISWFPELEPLEQDIPAYCWFQTEVSVQEWQAEYPAWLAIETVDAPLRCWINGEELLLRGWAETAGAGGAVVSPGVLADPGIRWANLSARLSAGHYCLVLLADYRRVREYARPDNRRRIPIDLVPAPARIVGEFRVLDRPRGRALTTREFTVGSLGSWTTAGYPHYSGAMSYRKTVAIPGDFTRGQIVLEIADAAACVTTYVDGSEIASLPWPPFRVDLTSIVRPGASSDLELVVHNTNSNALLGREDPSGLLGSVRLTAYPHVRVKGERYPTKG